MFICYPNLFVSFCLICFFRNLFGFSLALIFFLWIVKIQRFHLYRQLIHYSFWRQLFSVLVPGLNYSKKVYDIFCFCFFFSDFFALYFWALFFLFVFCFFYFLFFVKAYVFFFFNNFSNLLLALFIIQWKNNILIRHNKVETCLLPSVLSTPQMRANRED